MYAFKLKLGAATHTNDEVIYHGITFKGGVSTTMCSEREEQFFSQNGMSVLRVPVASPEFDDLRTQLLDASREIEQIKTNAAAYEARLSDGFLKQIAVLEKAVQDTVNERDEARKQLSLNLELISLREGAANGTKAVGARR